MPTSPHVIPTRQKTELLFSVIASVSSGATGLLGAGVTFSSPIMLVEGYGAINFLVISNAAFTLRIQEAPSPDGPWAQAESQASALDAVTGNQFICLQVAPCGSYMRVFVDNGATLQTSFSLAGIGLPIAGGGGSSSGGGGGGTSSIVQLRDGSAPAAATLASIKVDGTAIGTQGSVLAGGETPTGTQQALRVNAAGQLIVAGVPNRPTFAVNQQVVAVPGTAAQLQTQAVPDEFGIFLRALTENTGKIWVGPTAAIAQNHAQATPLDAGDFLILYLTNTNEIFIDAEVAGEGVSWTVEV